MRIMDENNNFYEIDGPYRVRGENVAYYFLEDDDTWEKTLVDVKTFIVNTAGESPKWKILEKSEYGGYLTSLHLLPVGTHFYVHSGAWRGCIMEQDGVKGVVVEGDEADFKPLSKVADADELAISIVIK